MHIYTNTSYAQTCIAHLEQRDVERLHLGDEVDEERLLWPLRVHHHRPVAKVPEMARSDQPVAAVVAWAANYERPRVRAQRVGVGHRGGNAQPGELHEAVNAERSEELHVDRRGLGGGKKLAGRTH